VSGDLDTRVCERTRACRARSAQARVIKISDQHRLVFKVLV